MTVIEALILGIVQGLTEFLPVSSSAHLVLVPDLMGWEAPSVSFDLVLHLGSMVAVIAYFWRDLLEIVKAFFEKGEAVFVKRRVGLFLVIGTIPAAVIGGLLGIMMGAGSSMLLSRLSGWAIYISPFSVVLAFGFSATVGIVFGFWPAKKASLLSPIDALRYE